MNNLNSVLIEGNMVSDPVIRSTAKGTSVCTFSMVSSRFYRGGSGIEKEVSFFDIETRSVLAESCEKLGYKGRGVRLVGRLKQYNWTDSDGKSHSKVTIAAEHIEFRPDVSNELTYDEDVPLDEIAESEPVTFIKGDRNDTA
jgi:single-strand DNA-binding protein